MLRTLLREKKENMLEQMDNVRKRDENSKQKNQKEMLKIKNTEQK